MNMLCRSTCNDLVSSETECSIDVAPNDAIETAPGGGSLLRRYVREVNAFEMLDHDTEVSLSRSCQAGDVHAAHRLITSHLRLVVRIAFDYKNYGLPMMDLISEGSLGLTHAVKKFDPSFGCRLSTYAMWWIRAAIQDFILRSWSLVRIGTTAMQRRLFFSLGKIKRYLGISNDACLGDSDVKKIQDYTGARVNEITEIESRITTRDTSMHDIVGNDMVFEDILACDAPTPEVIIVEQDESKTRIADLRRAMMITLSERERYIVKARLLSNDKGTTLDELSKRFGISRERVRQITECAVAKLKREMVSTPKITNA